MQAVENNKPFIKLFKTPRLFYLYSVNRNTVVNISEELYGFLEDNKNFSFLSAEAAEEYKTLNENGYLSSKRIKKIRHPAQDSIEEDLSDHMRHLILQVTQSCNLVCAYCPFANKTDGVLQRNHSNKRMNFETAKRAMDFYLERSSAEKKNVISFYGGEPLLAFDLIKKCVEYADEIFIGKKIKYALTTNGTLLTDEIIDFFAEHEFDVMFSIDGPEKIHDSNRIHPDGSGSFSAAISNLKKLNEIYKKRGIQSNRSINMVVDPKYDPDEIFQLLEDPIFKNDILVYWSIVDDSQLAKTTDVNEIFDEKLIYYQFLVNLKIYRIVNALNISPVFIRTYGNNSHDFYRLKKGIGSLPDVGSPGGPCVPGVKKLYVNADGDLYPCEVINETSDCMRIGNLDNGLDLKKAVSLLNIASLTENKCKNCWGLSFCKQCALNCEKDGVISAEKRLSNCKQELERAETAIHKYILCQECKTVYIRG